MLIVRPRLAAPRRAKPVGHFTARESGWTLTRCRVPRTVEADGPYRSDRYRPTLYDRESTPMEQRDDTERALENGAQAGTASAQPSEDSDTEGHGLLPDPVLNQQLARSRNADIDRDVRARQHRDE